jgi:large repetitive protein
MSLQDIVRRDRAPRKSPKRSRARSRLARSGDFLVVENLEGRVLLSGNPPTAVDDSYNTPVDAPLTVPAPGVLGNDTDPENDVLTAVVVNQPTSGAVVLSSDGSFVYTPNAGFHGSDSFTYHANDGTSDSNDATVAIQVNDAPVSSDDSYNVNEDATLSVAAPGVLTNDSDVNGDALTAVLVTGPAHGAFALNSDGSFTYTPSTGFFGVDTFTYHANDGVADGNDATATITVAHVNHAPVAVDDAYTTGQDSPLSIAAPAVLGNDADSDGDALAAVKVTDPANGALTLNPDGSFLYTPTPGFHGSDSFTYHANDGNLDSNDATVVITVNDAPVAVDDAYTISQDGALTVDAPGVLANDNDANGDALTAVLGTGPIHGALTLNPDGSFTYTPTAGFHGSDSFTYHANDGVVDGSDATVAIIVNDAPVSGDDSFNVNQDDTLSVAAPGVLANDSDVNGDALTAVLVTGPAHGEFALNADGSFTYTPTAGFFGVDTFTYHANDGFVDGNDATATIDVAHVNHAPVADSDDYGTGQDSILTILAPGVLGNDTDSDGDPLTAVQATGPAHGALTLNADGSFTYTPVAGFHGSDSFTYHANDGASDSNDATVAITVNDAPVSSDDSFNVNEDDTLSVAAPGVLVNDSDVNGDALTAVLVTGPSHGGFALNADGSFTYTPAAGFFGVDTFTYHANDGVVDGNDATVTINVAHVNHAPVAVGDDFSVGQDATLTVAAPGVLANDTDSDGDALTAIEVAGPSHGALTLNADGSLTYTPTAGFFGADSFTYHVSDGTLSSGDVTVNLTVTPINHAPTATNDSFSIAEGGTLEVTAPGVVGNDVDPDGDPLSAVLAVNAAHGALTLNADGSFTYTPNVGFSGADSFSYHATDGTLTSGDATVNLTVTHVNHAPAAANDSFSVPQDSTLTITAPGVLANDVDSDGDSVSAVIVAPPTHGALTLLANGSFTYAPHAGFVGIDSFTYRASDGTLQSSVALAAITVTHVNHAPTAMNGAYTTAQDVALSVPSPGVLSGSTDPDGDSLSSGVFSAPAHGAITLHADGSFVYTPSAGFHGQDSFSYRANDGQSASNVATVAITVTATTSSPSITAEGAAGNDTGVVGDYVTSNTTPAFTGQAPAGFLIGLYAQPRGAGGIMLVGQAIAGSDGKYTVFSRSLRDGAYLFGVSATDPAAPGAGPVATRTIGGLTIDATAPRVASIQLAPRAAKIYLTFTDALSNLVASTLLTSGNYKVSKLVGANRIRDVAIASVIASGPNQIALILQVGRGLPAGRYRITAFSAGVIDFAGNALDGEFSGVLPSGNGHAGGDFVVRLDSNGKKVSPPKPFVSQASISGVHTTSLKHPSGPVKLAHARRFGR